MGTQRKLVGPPTEGSAVMPLHHCLPAGPRAVGNAGTQGWVLADAPAQPGALVHVGVQGWGMEEQPKQIIVTRKGMLDPLEVRSGE